MQPGISPNVEANRQAMKQALGTSVDIIYRGFISGFRGARKGLIVFVEGLADGKAVEALIAAAVQFANPPYEQPPTKADPILDFAETVAHTIEFSITKKLETATHEVLSGNTLLFLDGAEHVLIAGTRYNPGRNVSEPTTESEVRGPRDGFIETLRVNTVLVRRRIRDPKLRMESLVVGERTRTDVVVAYIEGLASPDLVAEVRSRLHRVKIDAVLESGYIDELIQDNPWSPFGSTFSTERPDRVAAALLEGRVAIMTDNTPFVLIVPTVFWQFLQAPGDYYHNWWAGTGFRLIRQFALLVALVLPSLYVILTTYHHEMIPTPMALSVAGGREGTPLPTIGEVLGMEIMFEIMHEAGLRLPRAVGQTVSIVGALVIGQAAVQAGLVSPTTVIVIATTGITGFALPIYSASIAIRLMRFPLLLLSSALGVFGFITGTTVLALHLASLRSFGEAYLAPVAPMLTAEMNDSVVRAPWWAQVLRPRLGTRGLTKRIARGQKPTPPNRGGKTK